MRHVVKCYRPWFRDISDRRKTAELRLLDRHYQVGDEILLQETDDEYVRSGREILVKITHIVRFDEFRPALKLGYGMISFRIMSAEEMRG